MPFKIKSKFSKKEEGEGEDFCLNDKIITKSEFSD